MIHEFAVEPEALAKFNPIWQALEQFGVEYGRLVSAYPSKWLRHVYDATNGCKPMERKQLEVRLGRLRQKVRRFGAARKYDGEKPWRENVLVGHEASPFCGIIQSDNPNNHDAILTPTDLHDENECWACKREDRIERSSEQLAAALAPLGCLSSELLFVDPHFSTEVRWTRVLAELLTVCDVGGGKKTRIEFHTGAVPTRDVLEPAILKWVMNRFRPSVSIRFVLWEQKELGEKLHARYFLTELGGIRYDVGLDEGEPGETTDVGLLSRNLYADRWAEFQLPTAAYSIVDDFTLQGTRT